MALTLILRPVPVGTRERLLTFGHRNQGQLLFIERLAADQIRIGYAPTAGTPLWSEPFLWPPGRPQTITVSTGAQLPPLASSLWPANLSPEARALAKRDLECRLEERTVWRAEIPSLDISSSTIVPGRNDLLITGWAHESGSTGRSTCNIRPENDGPQVEPPIGFSPILTWTLVEG